MNKKLRVIFALSMLLAAMPVKPISHHTAALLTALSMPGYFFVTKKILDRVSEDGQSNLVNRRMAGAGVLIGTPSTYWALYKLTPNGRYDRANTIVEKLKDKFPRFFAGAVTTNLEQILHDLGAFNKTHTNNRNFVYLNALEELDYVTKKLKKAESLLLAAKKDIYPEVIEWCKASASKLYAKIAKTSVVDVPEPKNHKDLEVKIDSMLGKIQAMLNQVTSLYSYIEFHGSKEYKQQLKEYEELRTIRSQNTKAEVINFAIPTATIAASVAAVALASGWTYRAMRTSRIIGQMEAHAMPVADEYTY